MSVFSELKTLARKLNNWAEDATGGGLWTSDTVYAATVPANKRWFLFGGMVDRDVSGTANIYLHDSSAEIIMLLNSVAAGTGRVPYPVAAYTGTLGFPIPMDAGEYVRIVLGASQSTAAKASCLALEVNA